MRWATYAVDAFCYTQILSTIFSNCKRNPTQLHVSLWRIFKLIFWVGTRKCFLPITTEFTNVFLELLSFCIVLYWKCKVVSATTGWPKKVLLVITPLDIILKVLKRTQHKHVKLFVRLAVSSTIVQLFRGQQEGSLGSHRACFDRHVKLFRQMELSWKPLLCSYVYHSIQFSKV